MNRMLLLTAFLSLLPFASFADEPAADEEPEDELILRVPAPCSNGNGGYPAPKGAKLVGFPLPEARVNKLLADKSWMEDLKYPDVVSDLFSRLSKEHQDEVIRRFLTQQEPKFFDFPKGSGLTTTLLLELEFEMCGVVLRAE